MPTRKTQRLIARAQETRRAPQPKRLTEDKPQKKGYRVVAVSLYTPESDWIDQVTQLLQRAGLAKANRSLVVREAILELQEELKQKDPKAISRHFVERHARRAGGL
jgi:hypothetical protein